MPLDAALKDSRGNLPDCFFAGLVDLDMGLMIGFDPQGPFSQDEIDRLAAMAVVYFASTASARVGSATGKIFGETSEAPVSEVLVAGKDKAFAYCKLACEPGRVVLYVCKATEDPEALLAAARTEAEKLASVDILT
jgi:hypothetical protein